MKTECIFASGYVNPRTGYALSTKMIGGKRLLAHRAAYQEKYGKIPEKMVLDHLCRNRLCINVDHLELVTQRENIMRGEGIARKFAERTHCAKNHLLDGNNIYLYKNRRLCRACRKDYDKKYRILRGGVSYV